MGWFEGWSPNPCHWEITLNACVCSVQGQHDGVQVCRGTEKHREVLWHGNNSSDWQHGIWQVLYPKSCTVAFKIANLFVVAYVGTGKNFTQINMSPRKGSFQKEGRLPSIMFEGIFVSFLGNTFYWDRYGKAPKHTSEWFFPISLPWNRSQISQNQSPFTYLPQSLQQIPIASCPLPNLLAWWASTIVTQ